MRKLIIILSVMFVLLYTLSLVQADDWMSEYTSRAPRAGDYARLMEHRQAERLAEVQRIVVAVSPYRNPYFRPNSNYEPGKIGEPAWVHNEFSGEMGKPPRGLLEILVPGTYTIKKPEAPQPYVGRR